MLCRRFLSLMPKIKLLFQLLIGVVLTFVLLQVLELFVQFGQVLYLILLFFVVFQELVVFLSYPIHLTIYILIIFLYNHCKMISQFSFLAFLLFFTTTNSNSCNSVPYALPTPCNLTCELCSNTRNTCLSCQQYMTLKDNKCAPASSQTLFFSDYFVEANITNDTVGYERFSREQASFSTANDYVQFCMANKYKWEIIGLFSTENRILFENNYEYPISQISLNFRFFTLRSINILNIWVNNIKRFSYAINKGSELNNNLNNETRQFPIQIDYSDSIDSLMIPVRTGFLTAPKTPDISIKITVTTDLNSNQSSTEFWGFSQASVIAIQCNVCVNEATRELGNAIGIGILVSSGFLLFMVIILCAIVRFREYSHKEARKNKFRKQKKEHA